MPRLVARPLIRTALLSLSLLPAAEAAAQSEPIRLSIDSWVAEIDALAEWTAAYQDLSVAGDTATVTGLAFRNVDPDALAVELGTLTIEGYTEPGNSGFSASRIALDRLTVSAGDAMIAEASNIALEGVGFPGLDDRPFDQSKPFTSIMRSYAVAARATLDRGSVGQVAVTQSVGNEQSRVTYVGIEFGPLANGVLESLSTGALTMISPAPEGLIQFNVERVESRRTDLGAFTRVFDPEQYAGGVGDMVWHSVFGFGAYHDISITAPGAVVTIHELSIEDFRVRQPERPFNDMLDATMANPNLPRSQMEELSEKHALDMLSSFGIGKLTVRGFDVAAEGMERLHLGDITLEEFSIEGLGQFAFTDLDFIASEQGSGGIERFAFGNLVFPEEKAIRAMIASESGNGAAPDPLSMIPTLGYVELTGGTFAEIGQLPASIDRFRLTMAGHVGPIPTVMKIESTGQRAPISLIQDRNIRSAATALGYTEIVADTGLEIAWREEDSSLVVSDYHIRIADVGSVTMDLAFAGLTREMIEDPELLEDAADRLTFTSARIRVEDDSLLQRIIESQARQMNVTAERFREQIAGAIPFTLMVLQNSGFQTQIGPALQNFVRNGGALTLTAMPTAPVPFSTLMETATSAPQNLPNLLSITIVSE